MNEKTFREYSLNNEDIARISRLEREGAYILRDNNCIKGKDSILYKIGDLANRHVIIASIIVVAIMLAVTTLVVNEIVVLGIYIVILLLCHKGNKVYKETNKELIAIAKNRFSKPNLNYNK